MNKKPVAASSRPEKLVVKSEADMHRYLKSVQFQRDSERIRELGDQDIDFSDIAKLTEAELAKLARPKQQLTVRLDTDIVDWLKAQKGPYQTRMNAILRLVMEHSRVLSNN